MISKATQRNWEKLKIDNIKTKLTTRANKTESKKIILPKEYFTNKKNINVVKEFLSFVKEKNIREKTVINSLCLNQLYKNDLLTMEDKFIAKQNNVIEILDEIQDNYNLEIVNYNLPQDEIDLIGLIYQCLLKEGDKNIKGSYFTPYKIIKNLTQNFDFKNGQTILDPCCGSGVFLLNLKCPLKNIYAIDNDSLAVLITKVNLITAYKGQDEKPNVFCEDFLTKSADFKVDYIATNTPWGTKYKKDYSKLFEQINSKEIFSYFIVKCFNFLKENGKLRVVMPESILNVEIHRDIRKFIVENFGIEQIYNYGQCFQGVTTNVYTINLVKGKKIEKIKIFNVDSYEIESKNFARQNNYDFNLTRQEVKNLLQKIYSIRHQSLSKCEFGMGIVTGNNKEKLTNVNKKGLIPIYTGKEIMPYKLKENYFYIKYDRDNLQQVSEDKIYFAPEKLIYRFISKKLVFAYDDKQSLCLNSANIIVPQDMGMSAKSLCMILNSRIMEFIYQNSFGQLKVLKGNLLRLPIPIIDKKTDAALVEMFDNSEFSDKKIDSVLAQYFNLDKDDLKIIYKEK